MKWQYTKIVPAALDEQGLRDVVDGLGHDGWEMCGVMPATWTSDGTRWLPVYLWFKKPIAT